MRHTLKAQMAIFIALMLNFIGAHHLSADYCSDDQLNLCFLEGIEIWGDFLYWKPCVNGMSYAAHIDSPDAAVNGSYDQNIRYDTLRWDWSPGFRAGLAIHDVWGDWRLSGSYTYLDTNEKALTTAETGEIVLSPWHFGPLTNPSLDPTDPGGFDRTRVKAHLGYQSWELLLSRFIETRGCYTIASFVGAEGLFIDQKVFVRSRLNREPEATPANAGFSIVDWRSDFKAYGIKFGADCIFPIGCNFQFFSRGAFTLALGENDDHNSQPLQHNGVDPVIQEIHSHEELADQWINGYQIQIGLIYASELCGYDFGMRLGYEFVKWHNIPTPSKVSSGNQEPTYHRDQFVASDRTTLGFHGLVAGLSLMF